MGYNFVYPGFQSLVSVCLPHRGFNIWAGGFLTDINDTIELEFMDNLTTFRLPISGSLLICFMVLRLPY
jgi:hypothetical protein